MSLAHIVLDRRPCDYRYYDRIFPSNLMCRWLSYGTQHEDAASQHLLPRREFSFTTGDDVYIRYLSYENAAALKKVRAWQSLGLAQYRDAVIDLLYASGCHCRTWCRSCPSRLTLALSSLLPLVIIKNSKFSSRYSVNSSLVRTLPVRVVNAALYSTLGDASDRHTVTESAPIFDVGDNPTHYHTVTPLYFHHFRSSLCL